MGSASQGPQEGRFPRHTRGRSSLPPGERMFEGVELRRISGGRIIIHSSACPAGKTRNPLHHLAMTTVKRGRGRPSKGLRSEVKLRVPPALKDVTREVAREQGITENDLYTAIVARYFGMQKLSEVKVPARHTALRRKQDEQEGLFRETA